MSTRSMVAIKRKDGTVLGMWKHWDGNPAFMLPLLNDHGRFAEEDLAEELVKFESCEAIFTQEYLDDHRKKIKNFCKDEDLTPLSNGCYIECGTGQPTVYKNLRECFREDIEYLYVWKEGGYKWAVIDATMLDEME